MSSTVFEKANYPFLDLVSTLNFAQEKNLEKNDERKRREKYF